MTDTSLLIKRPSNVNLNQKGKKNEDVQCRRFSSVRKWQEYKKKEGKLKILNMKAVHVEFWTSASIFVVVQKTQPQSPGEVGLEKEGEMFG